MGGRGHIWGFVGWNVNYYWGIARWTWPLWADCELLEASCARWTWLRLCGLEHELLQASCASWMWPRLHGLDVTEALWAGTWTSMDFVCALGVTEASWAGRELLQTSCARWTWHTEALWTITVQQHDVSLRESSSRTLYDLPRLDCFYYHTSGNRGSAHWKSGKPIWIEGSPKYIFLIYTWCPKNIVRSSVWLTEERTFFCDTL